MSVYATACGLIGLRGAVDHAFCEQLSHDRKPRQPRRTVGRRKARAGNLTSFDLEIISTQSVSIQFMYSNKKQYYNNKWLSFSPL